MLNTMTEKDQNLLNDLVQILGDTFGDDGGMQAYHYEAAEQILPLLDEDFFTPSAVEAAVYSAYMDAVAARQIASVVEDMVTRD